MIAALMIVGGVAVAQENSNDNSAIVCTDELDKFIGTTPAEAFATINSYEDYLDAKNPAEIAEIVNATDSVGELVRHVCTTPGFDAGHTQ